MTCEEEVASGLQIPVILAKPDLPAAMQCWVQARRRNSIMENILRVTLDEMARYVLILIYIGAKVRCEERYVCLRVYKHFKLRPKPDRSYFLPLIPKRPSEIPGSFSATWQGEEGAQHADPLQGPAPESEQGAGESLSHCLT